MKSSDLDYFLPESLIAQEPLLKRDQCRLCVVQRNGSPSVDLQFDQIGQFLRPGDLLVLNNSRVLPFRIPCRKKGSAGAVEVFLLEGPQEGSEGKLRAFLKPARRAKRGQHLFPELSPDSGFFEILDGDSDSAWVQWRGTQNLDSSFLSKIGLTPLPPYIKRDRLPPETQSELDAHFYQTVYAKDPGSAAAPTAGLHFTEALIQKLKTIGVQFGELTLHVGTGTFLPVKTETLEEHRMHRERYHLSQDLIEQIQSAKKRQSRVIAVGTTSARVLEAAFDREMRAEPGWAETDIFIRPGYEFRVLDGLITNFHQPKSTLIALVAAFYDLNKILEIYAACIVKKYRFLSFGDAMFII